MKWVLVRHANALPIEGMHDRYRVLSPQGCGQAASVLTQLITKFDGRFVPDIVFTSPLLRVEQTLDILLGGRAGREAVKIVSLPSLFNHPEEAKAARIQASFDRLRYAPLEAYLADPDGILIRELATVMDSEMDEVIGSTSSSPGTVLITGHAIALPALFEKLVQGYSVIRPEDPIFGHIRKINLGEAEAIYWDSFADNPNTFEIISPMRPPRPDETVSSDAVHQTVFEAQ